MKIWFKRGKTPKNKLNSESQEKKKESFKKRLTNSLKKIKPQKDWFTLGRWIKRLDRYIIVKFLGTYFFAIALIITISVVFDINENIDSS